MLCIDWCGFFLISQPKLLALSLINSLITGIVRPYCNISGLVGFGRVLDFL